MTITLERGLGVPMRDGPVLRADLYRPARPGRYPTVILRTPYDRGLGGSYGQQLNAVRLAESGYAVLIQDVRGRFESEGAFYPFRHEAADGVDTLEWVSSRPWSNGATGMLGSSYCGFVQALAARHPHPSLRAIVPALAPLEARDGWVHEGGAFCLGFNLSWTLAHIAPRDARTEHPERLLAALDDWPRVVARPPREHPELTATPAAGFYFDWLSRAGDAEYWSELGASGLGDRAPPALVLAGWFDLFAKGSFDLYADLARGGDGRHRLIAGPWDHSPLPLASSAGESEFGVAAALDLHLLQRQWLDLHLRGADEPEWPVARIFVTGWNRWESWAAWPPAARRQSWYLASPGGLTTDAPPATTERFRVAAADPTPSLGGPLCCWKSRLAPGQADQRRRAERPDVVSFCSEPLGREVVIAGRVEAEIWSGTSSVGGDIFVTLVDVGLDGRALNVVEGMRRRLQADADPEPFEVDLGHAAHAFAPGHRVRLDVAAASFPRFDPLITARTVERTIEIGPSRLVLPELG